MNIIRILSNYRNRYLFLAAVWILPPHVIAFLVTKTPILPLKRLSGATIATKIDQAVFILNLCLIESSSSHRQLHRDTGLKCWDVHYVSKVQFAKIRALLAFLDKWQILHRKCANNDIFFSIRKHNVNHGQIWRKKHDFCHSYWWITLPMSTIWAFI